jgi:hypothetical protein
MGHLVAPGDDVLHAGPSRRPHGANYPPG